MPWSTSGRRAELPSNWGSIRARILARDGGQCRAIDNGVRCQLAATDVDHIGDRHDHGDANLQSLCSWHHRRKTARESGAARRQKPWVRRARPAERHPGEL